MPLVPFETLPDSARVWVFGSDRPLSDDATEHLMQAVEKYLDQWKAHGEPLTAAYDWVDVIVGFDTFMGAARYGNALACQDGLLTKLITPIAAPVPQLFFKRHQKFFAQGQSIVAECRIETYENKDREKWDLPLPSLSRPIVSDSSIASAGDERSYHAMKARPGA